MLLLCIWTSIYYASRPYNKKKEERKKNLPALIWECLQSRTKCWNAESWADRIQTPTALPPMKKRRQLLPPATPSIPTQQYLIYLHFVNTNVPLHVALSRLLQTVTMSDNSFPRQSSFPHQLRVVLSLTTHSTLRRKSVGVEREELYAFTKQSQVILSRQKQNTGNLLSSEIRSEFKPPSIWKLGDKKKMRY